MEFTLLFIELFFWILYLIAPLIIFMFIVIMILGQVVSNMEKWDRFDGMYWALITATTVGYGDIRPLKKTSKVLSVLIALIGMVFTGIIISAALNSASIALEKHANEEIIERMKVQVN